MATRTATDEGRHAARAGSLTVADLLERTVDTERGTRAARGLSGGCRQPTPYVDLFTARTGWQPADSTTDPNEAAPATRSVVQLMPAAAPEPVRPTGQVLGEVRQNSAERRRQRTARRAATFAAAAAVVAFASVGTTSLLAEPSPSQPGAMAAAPATAMAPTSASETAEEDQVSSVDGTAGTDQPVVAGPSLVDPPASAQAVPPPTNDVTPPASGGQDQDRPTARTDRSPAPAEAAPPQSRGVPDPASVAPSPGDPALPLVRDFFESLPAQPDAGESLLGPLPSIFDPVGLIPSWDQVSRVQPTAVTRVDNETLQVTSLVYRDNATTLRVQHLVRVTEQPNPHILDGELITTQLHQ